MKYFILLSIILIVSCSKHFESYQTTSKNSKQTQYNRPHTLKKFIIRPKKYYGNLPKIALNILENSKKIIYLTIDPKISENSQGDKYFHKFPILSKIEIIYNNDKIDFINQLYDNISNADYSVARCFYPRHGIRIINENDTWDWVICFQCGFARVYKSSQKHFYEINLKDNPKYFNDLAISSGMSLNERLR